jgi:hypothetical protein
VYIMKLDNSLGKHVQKIKPKQEKEHAIDFKEISGQNKDEAGSESE